MKLSIVIVNWNTRKLLQDCLMSVRMNPPGQPFEVLIVDNASSDGSAGMVRAEFPDWILIENSENRGFAAANNQAIEMAKGEYVLLLNSDTLVHRDVLSRTIEYMDHHPEAGVMGCRVLNADGTTQTTCSEFPTLMNLALLTSGLWKLGWPKFLGKYQMNHWDRNCERSVDVVSGCYMCVRKEAIHEVGMMDESFFFFGEETDWCRRFQKAGWAVRFSPVGEITHFGGGSARRLSHRRDLMLTSAHILLHRKHYGLVSAAFAWSILLLFNVSRAAGWTVMGLMKPGATGRERRRHFLGVVRQFHRTWVRDRTLHLEAVS